MKTSEVLAKAADLIDERGHAHEYYLDNDGKVCAIGAIRLAAGGQIVPQTGMVKNAIIIDVAEYEYARTARMALEGFLNLDLDVFSVVEWNDRNDKDEVVTALRNAANWEQEKGN